MDDSNRQAKETEKEVKKKGQEKAALIKELEDMTQKKQQMETQIKKNVDELNECKYHKHFLDILAIQAGLKKFVPNSMKIDQ